MIANGALPWTADSPIGRFESGVELDGDTVGKWDFYESIQRKLEDITRYVSRKADIASSAELVGQVFIDDGAIIMPNAFIEGPVFIGEGATVGHSALIRPGSFLSRRSLIGGFSYCTASVLGPDARAAHYCGVSRSLLEANSYLTAFVVTATVRPDFEEIIVAGRRITKRGCLMGSGAVVSPHVTIGPGVVIGRDSFVGSFLDLRDDVLPSTYTYAERVLNSKPNRVSARPRSTSVISHFERDLPPSTSD